MHFRKSGSAGKVSRQIVQAAGLLAAGLLLTTPAAAQSTITWTSHDTAVDPSSNANVNNPLNWSGGVVPVDGDTLRFPGPVANGTRTVNNDLTGLTVGGFEVVANQYTFGGNAIKLAGDIKFSAGANSTFGITAPVTLQSAVTIYNDKSTTQTPVISLGSVLSGPFGLTLDSVTAGNGGQTQINVGMTYTGDTTVNNGNLYLRLGVPYSGVAKGNLNIAASGSVLSNNLNFNFGALNGSGGLSKAGSNTRTVTIGENDADGDYSGTITWTGGSSSLAKNGTGTQRLSGPVTVSGSGVINAGTLLVDNTWTAGIIINASGTLGGNGSIAGAVTGAGRVAPGASIGILTAGSAAPSGSLEIELDGTDAGSSDVFAVSAGLDVSLLTLNFSQITPVDDAAYVFATYGTLSGTFAAVTNLPANYEINYSYGGNNIAIQAVPEPTVGVLGAVGLLLGFRRRR